MMGDALRQVLSSHHMKLGVVSVKLIKSCEFNQKIPSINNVKTYCGKINSKVMFCSVTMVGNMVTQWLALPPHSEKSPGAIH